MGEGDVRDAGGRRMAAADALAAAGLAPVDARREGGPRPASTAPTACSASWSWPSRTCDALLPLADVAAACRSRRCAGPTASSLDEIHALRPHPGQRASAANLAALLADSPIVELAPRRRHPGPGRLLPALRPPGPRRRARHLGPRHARRRRRAGLGDRQPVGPRRRRRWSPTATSTARPSATCSTSSPSPWPTSPRCPSGAPTACSTSQRSFGLPPFLAHQAGVDSGLMIAQYSQAALVSEMKRLAVAGERRLDPLVGDAGGPRLDGLARRAQAAPRPSTRSPTCWPSSCSPGARAMALRAPLARLAGHRRRSSTGSTP